MPSDDEVNHADFDDEDAPSAAAGALSRDGQFLLPVFDALLGEEGGVRVLERFGFDWYTIPLDDPDGGDPAKLAVYARDGVIDLNGWRPAPRDGFVLAARVDSDDGPLCLFAKPLTALARHLMAYPPNIVALAALDLPR